MHGYVDEQDPAHYHSSALLAVTLHLHARTYFATNVVGEVEIAMYTTQMSINTRLSFWLGGEWGVIWQRGTYLYKENIV